MGYKVKQRNLQNENSIDKKDSLNSINHETLTSRSNEQKLNIKNQDND